MKIGIITFWQSQDNYGQILQGYALQQTLTNIGHKSFIIRYGFHEKCFPESYDERIFAKLHVFFYYKIVKDALKTFFCRNNKYSRNFNAFRYKRMNWSLHFYNYLNELVINPPKAEVYITGSDQVWAQLLSNNENRVFFLDFGLKETKRIAYAPSFAVKEYPKALNQILAEKLSRFDAISVREKTGVEICRNIGFNAVEVLDPTLLLLGSFYRKIAKKSKADNYAFVYHVNIESSEDIYWDSFKMYNETHNLKTIATYANPDKGVNMEFLDGARYYYPSVEEWIGLIDAASYVLTSSFHGMVFSILLHKPFVVCLRKETLFSGNDRITSLLSKLNLESQIYALGRNVEQIISNPIDWKTVDRALDALRSFSVDYLKSNIH